MQTVTTIGLDIAKWCCRVIARPPTKVAAVALANSLLDGLCSRNR